MRLLIFILAVFATFTTVRGGEPRIAVMPLVIDRDYREGPVLEGFSNLSDRIKPYLIQRYRCTLLSRHNTLALQSEKFLALPGAADAPADLQPSAAAWQEVMGKLLNGARAARYRPGTLVSDADDALRKEHRRKMAHHAEGAGFGRHARIKGMAVDHSARNEVDHLFENDCIAPGWWCVFHFTLPSGRDFISTPAHFSTFNHAILWDDCEILLYCFDDDGGAMLNAKRYE